MTDTLQFTNSCGGKKADAEGPMQQDLPLPFLLSEGLHFLKHRQSQAGEASDDSL
jgi:hypothetical protein